MKALELRAKGAADQEVSEQTGFHPSTAGRLVPKYQKNRIEAISGNYYGGNRFNFILYHSAVL